MIVVEIAIIAISTDIKFMIFIDRMVSVVVADAVFIFI